MHNHSVQATVHHCHVAVPGPGENSPDANAACSSSGQANQSNIVEVLEPDMHTCLSPMQSLHLILHPNAELIRSWQA